MAQTFAITGGTVALGDGSQPIPNGTVIVRDGRIVTAGDVRMKLPASVQVIDATGKWVTPGIVGAPLSGSVGPPLAKNQSNTERIA